MTAASISIHEAREILGPLAEGRSDLEVARLVAAVETLAWMELADAEAAALAEAVELPRSA